MKFVKVYQQEPGGVAGLYEIPASEAEKRLRRSGKQAWNLLRSTGADHVVYGIKVYDEEGKWKEVQFYMVPMDDDTFRMNVARLHGCKIYAHHARR